MQKKSRFRVRAFINKTMRRKPTQVQQHTNKNEEKITINNQRFSTIKKTGMGENPVIKV